MHKSIIAVYDGDQKSSGMIWHRDRGWIVATESLSNGQIVWAEHDGSKRLADNGHQGRVRMTFDKPSSDVVWPEVFARFEAARSTVCQAQE